MVFSGGRNRGASGPIGTGPAS